jgi:DNA-binding MarR family transcriptional regulator
METANGEPNPISLDGPGARAFLGMLRVATESATRIDVVLRRTGNAIKASEWDLLALIAVIGPLRPSELEARSSLSGNPTTVSTILNRLEKKGFVIRKPHDTDPRGVVVHLTAGGQELFDEVFAPIVNKVVRPFELNFTAEELETLADFWSRV